MDESRIVSAFLQLGVLVFSLCLHEFGHAWAANRLGDPTAKMLGRLTIDPRAHVHPIGTILFPLLMIFFPGLPLIGWAKPVPVTAENFKNPRWDMTLVAVAGPSMNILLASLSIFALWFCDKVGVFSMDPTTGSVLLKFLTLFLFINFFLAVFNLLPIPPLDGGWLLKAILPGPWAYRMSQLEPYSIIILLVLLNFGFLSNYIFFPALSLLEVVLHLAGVDQLGIGLQ